MTEKKRHIVCVNHSRRYLRGEWGHIAFSDIFFRDKKPEDLVVIPCNICHIEEGKHATTTAEI